ncbi:MAG: hypothetical protein K6C32_01735 [Bacilli bacterium]|nr:hypothetical protein [Bacilli bacterium]
MKLRKIEISLISILLTAFIAIFVLSIIFPTGYILGGDYEYLITIILSFILLFWGISMIYRVQFKKQRTYIIVLVLSFFFWIILRFIKWLPNIHYVSIYADYFYYVPMTVIPIIFFMMTLDTFYPEFKKKRMIYTILFILAYFLIALVLTNQLHYLVYKDYQFSHGENPNIEIIISSYGPLHYVALGFVGLVSLGAFITFAIGSRKQLSISQIIIVSISFLLIIIYIALFTAGVFSGIPFLRDFATCITLVLTMLLEALLSIGLIQNNGQYVSNFSKASIGMGIYNEQEKLIYSTPTFNLEKKNIKVINKEIGSYKATIIEDLNAINILQDNIKKEASKIDEANKNLKSLIAINKEKASLEYRLSLINEIENNISSTRNEILKLSEELPDVLDEEAKNKLGYISMLLGYMKQKCMLLLRAKEETNLNYEQASLLLNVIARDIPSAGYEDVAIRLNKADSFEIKFLSKINDFIHVVAKSYAFNNAELLVFINSENGSCKVRIIGENIPLKDIPGSISENDDEGVCHILEVHHE